MTLRHHALLLIVPLAFLGLTGCDGGEQASQETEQTTAPAEEAASTSQQAEAPESTDGTGGAGESTASDSADDEQASAPDAQAEPEAAGPTRVAASDDGKAAAQSLGCTACHAATTQLVGPSYQAVAKKYGGDQAKILERMKAAVEDGASGSWSDVTGGTPMPPQPQAAGKPDQLKAIAGWIAGLAE